MCKSKKKSHVTATQHSAYIPSSVKSLKTWTELLLEICKNFVKFLTDTLQKQVLVSATSLSFILIQFTYTFLKFMFQI